MHHILQSNPKRSALAALLACALLANPGRLVAEEPATADSPERAFESFRTAVEREDWQAVYHRLGPKSRKFLLLSNAGLIMAVASRADEEHPAVEKIFADHRIDVERLKAIVRNDTDAGPEGLVDEQRFLARLWEELEDRPSFFAAVSAYFARSRVGNGIPTIDILHARLENLHAEPNSTQAQAVAVTGSGDDAVGLPLLFLQSQAGWTIELP